MDMRLKVLVVGQEVKTLLALTKSIRQEDGEAVTAGDVTHALAQARGLGPQVIVLDSRLADAGSRRVLQALRASAHTAALPVLLVGACDEALGQSLLAEGAQEWLADPLDGVAVCAALRRLRTHPLVVRQAPAAALEDAARLADLTATGLMDSPPDAAFERVTRLVAALLSVPTALLSLVDQERQFFKSQIGLADPWARRRQTPLTHSFCQWVVSGSEPVSVDDARRHALLGQNLAVSDLGVIAYAGVPVRSLGGLALGSLCAIDARPRAWSANDEATLQHLARLAEYGVARVMMARESPPTEATLEAYAEVTGAAIGGAMGVLRRQGGVLQQAERELLCEVVEECGHQLVQLSRLGIAWSARG